ncbi:MAG: putative bifunctional diguanylate cyclase/phosphodiesterase [Candidatus Izemoplasmatales bacterium]
MKKRREKFKSISKLYFIVPLIFIVAIFSYINVVMVRNRVVENYEILEKESLSLAKSHSVTLANAVDANDQLDQLIEDKLRNASQMLAQDDGILDNQYMIEKVDDYDLDVIFYYNSNMEVIYSSIPEHIGWRPSFNHPVRSFYQSGLESYVEEIRPSSKLDEPYKYGYYRLYNDEFIQVGLSEQSIQEIIYAFEIDRLLEEMNVDETIDELFFINNQLTITHSTNESSVGASIQESEIIPFFSDDDINTVYINENSEKMFYVFVPIISDDQRIGTLVVTRSTEFVENIESEIISNGKYILSFALIILGVAAYLIYKRSQSFLDLAYYDRITGLPNDLYLRAYLKENMKDDYKKAIFLIDIKNFKIINLTYGYEYGDKIIIEAGKRLSNVLKDRGRLFRFSEDRYVFLLEEYQDTDDLVKAADDIEAIFDEPFKEVDEHQYIHSKIAILEINEIDKVDAILRNASIALNHTKDTQGKYTFFNQDMSDALARENYIEKIIIEALENQDEDILYLHYQPIIDSKTLKMVGVEALARMDTEAYGSIGPEEFIRVTESKLLIFSVGKFLFKRAIGFLTELDETYPDSNLHLSINVSILELLRADYIDYVEKTVKEFGVSPSRIELEVTESVFEEKFDLANNILGQLRKIGFRIALDDFGTGYSSFYRLREMNMDTIKIDQYFVHKILELKTEEYIIDEIIALSHKLGLKVVGEGVESIEQVNYLKSKNCDYLQGFYFDKSLSKSDILKLVKKQ